MPALGPYSQATCLARVDGRSREGRLLRSVRDELTRQIGNPSPAQKALIERAAWLSLRMAQLDARMLNGGFTDFDSKQYLAWSNGLTRLLRSLGLKGGAQHAVDLAEVLRGVVA
jgi:hypothetical protein